MTLLILFLIFTCLSISKTQNFSTEVSNINCNDTNCPITFGKCSSDLSKCICNNGYVDIISNNSSTTYCSYEQKYQLKAFLLEFFFPCGAGHLYVQNFLLGFIKLALVLGICLLGCSKIAMKMSSTRLTNNIMFISAFIVCLGLFAWQLFDLIYFGLNKYLDGNGVPLNAW